MKTIPLGEYNFLASTLYRSFLVDLMRDSKFYFNLGAFSEVSRLSRSEVSKCVLDYLGQSRVNVHGLSNGGERLVVRVHSVYDFLY
jgi:hypothetical protein